MSSSNSDTPPNIRAAFLASQSVDPPNACAISRKSKAGYSNQVYEIDGTWLAKLERYRASDKNDLGRELMYWANSQRQLRKKGKLRDEKIELLDSAGFQWETNKTRGIKRKVNSYTIDEKWLAMLHRYKMVVDKSNLADVEVKKWAETQRKMCKRGAVRQEKVELLQDAGFDFEGGRGRKKKRVV